MSDQRLRALEQRIAQLERERRPRPVSDVHTRRPSRGLAAGMLTLALLLPGVALASDQFTDVPTERTFHADIGAIAEAGVTGGCTATAYCPDTAVTRGQMAAFLRRAGGRVAIASHTDTLDSSLSVPEGTQFTDTAGVRELTITVPGVNNSFEPGQLVHLQGRVAFFTAMDSATKGCPCSFYGAIRDLTTGVASPVQFQMFESTSADPWDFILDVDALFEAPPGARTYRLEVGLAWRDDATNLAFFHYDGSTSLTAMTFPFGPQGTNAASTGAVTTIPNSSDGGWLERRRAGN